MRAGAAKPLLLAWKAVPIPAWEAVASADRYAPDCRDTDWPCGVASQARYFA